MSRAVFFAVLALAAVASATVLWERTELPKEWTKIGAAPANLKHRFTIALPQRNMDKLAAMTLERADPDNVQYANWLEHSEIMDLIAPAPEVQARVVAWLRKNIRAGEAVEILELRDAVKVTGPASFASRVFRTKLALFKHDRTGMIVARQLGTYEIPTALARDIEMVTGMADFPPQRLTLKQMQPKDAGTNNACNVPYTMRTLYNISQTLVIDNAHVSQAPFAQYPGDSEGFGMPGLLQWIKLNLLPARAANVTIYGNKASVYTNASTGDAEAQLDIQMQTGMGQGAAQGFYIEDGWMYDFAVSVFLEGSGAPWVVSMSYGWPEENQCANSVLGDQCKAAGIPGWRSYLVRAENEWLKVTATGRTIIASSGDTGAPGDNNDCSLTQTYPFHPGYPATGSWLTSVGATTLVNTAESDYVYSPAEDAPPICSNKQCQCSTSTTEETCMNSDCSFTAGGGFSLFLPTPTWQSAQIAAYMASSAKKPSSSLFNSSKRGFPDIAAIGWDVFIVGPNQMIGGTSASCPIIAGLISQLNNWRFSQGLKAMGFFNPLLYKMAVAVPESVHDITTGSNECMEGTCCPGLGYSATTGWDPVVGWGTPNWGQWQHYVANLPYDKYVGARL